MDFQYWLYIIIGIIYLVSAFRKKREEPSKDLPDFRPEKPVKRYEQPASKPTPQKALTFEELLREITEGKSGSQPPAVEPKPKIESKPAYVNYDDAVEEQDLEEDSRSRSGKRERVYAEYEEGKRQAFARPSLEETLKLEDTDIRFGRFKEFEQEQQRDIVGEYLGDFKDAEAWKKAVVMSEILQRKF